MNRRQAWASRRPSRPSEILREIQKECTIIVIEHDMDFMRQAADVVTVLHEGKVLTEGTVDEVLADATVAGGLSGTRQGRKLSERARKQC